MAQGRDQRSRVLGNPGRAGEPRGSEATLSERERRTEHVSFICSRRRTDQTAPPSRQHHVRSHHVTTRFTLRGPPAHGSTSRVPTSTAGEDGERRWDTVTLKTDSQASPCDRIGGDVCDAGIATGLRALHAFSFTCATNPRVLKPALRVLDNTDHRCLPLGARPRTGGHSRTGLPSRSGRVA